MSNVVNLAERRFAKRSPDNPSYYTVRKAGHYWAVMLITPNPGFREIRTTLAKSFHRLVAIDHAIEMNAKTGVPFKMRGRKI